MISTSWACLVTVGRPSPDAIISLACGIQGYFVRNSSFSYGASCAGTPPASARRMAISGDSTHLMNSQPASGLGEETGMPQLQEPVSPCPPGITVILLTPLTPLTVDASSSLKTESMNM